MKKWRLGLRRTVVFIMTAILLAGSAGSYMIFPVQAEENMGEDSADTGTNEGIIKISEETLLTSDDLPELPDTDELFWGYVEQSFYGDLSDGVSLYGNVGADRLTDSNEKKMYNELKAGIKDIADGKLNPTEITVKDLKLNKSTWGDSASNVISYLMMDCPYDLYWYDKTSTGGVSFRGSGNNDNITQIIFTFKVANEYQGINNTTINPATADTVQSAVSKANSIVSGHSGESDRDKLNSYRKAICDLAEYNHDAAENSSTAYGNPWQLIWVFDDDPNTKVVCEGYSKAFQYLCDLSDFKNDSTVCYTVSGYMNGGGHMWNIVTLGGKNYLADVTNSDLGTVGQDDSLFLTTPNTGTVDSFYEFLNNNQQSIIYQYDSDQIPLLGKKILSLSAPGEPSYDEPASGSGTDQGSDTKPDTGNDTKPDTGTDTKPDTGNDTKPDTGTDTKPDTGNDTKPNTGGGQNPNTGTGTTSGTDTTPKPQPSKATEKPAAPASKAVTLSLNSQKLKNNTTLKATFNKKYTFKATVTDKAGKVLKGGNGKITWSTSNKMIATVNSSGKVSVKKKAGTVTITAKTADGRTAKVKLKVSKAAVKVTKVKITGSKTMNLKKKKIQTLKAAVTPASAANQKVTWKSSNKKVATVSSKGKVTSKKAGTVTITAAAKDGSKKKAAIKIKVTKK